MTSKPSNIQYDYHYAQIYIPEKQYDKKEDKESENIRQAMMGDSNMISVYERATNMNEAKNIANTAIDNSHMRKTVQNNSDFDLTRSGNLNTDKNELGQIDFSIDKSYITKIITQFLGSFPKNKPIPPTFTLPQPIEISKISRWHNFASRKGIKKKRKEIFDTKNEMFLPAWGRYKMKIDGPVEEGVDQKTKKKFKKGKEKRTCTNERFIKRY